MQDQLLAGDVAVVTGAAGGIGRAIARRLASEGAAVVIADVDTEGGRQTADVIRDDGGQARSVRADVTDWAEVEAVVETAVDAFGGLDILVNNAGGPGADDNLHRIDESTWHRVLDLNLTGAFRCTRSALPHLVEAESGRVVHVSSVNATTGIGLTAYSAAKSGLLGFSRVVAAQYGRHGVRSNAIVPGTIRSPALEEKRDAEWSSDLREAWLSQYPLGRFGDPEEVADAAFFLASDLSSFATGTELVVDGGSVRASTRLSNE
ncbi:SDR family NAD(P)-dependent oxidoreductase [Halobacteriaceae archaeon GCM10025711]